MKRIKGVEWVHLQVVGSNIGAELTVRLVTCIKANLSNTLARTKCLHWPLAGECLTCFDGPSLYVTWTLPHPPRSPRGEPSISIRVKRLSFSTSYMPYSNSRIGGQ